MANHIWSVKLRRAKWRHVQITQQPNARKWGQNSCQPCDFTYYIYIYIYKAKIWFFSCLGFLVLHENVSLIWRGNHYPWRSGYFDLCSALINIEQWEFFSLGHGSFVYKIISHGIYMYTCSRAFGSVNINALITKKLDSNTISSSCKTNGLTDWTTIQSTNKINSWF